VYDKLLLDIFLDQAKFASNLTLAYFLYVAYTSQGLD